MMEVGLKAQQNSSDGNELGAIDTLAQLSNADIEKIKKAYVPFEKNA